jgi:glutamate formiminotransferase/formiminotetrahydrofolate cyclodeaminase
MIAMEVIKAMAEVGNPNSGLGCWCWCSLCPQCSDGAFMNVRINASGYDDKGFVDDVLAKGREIEKKTITFGRRDIKYCEHKIGV